MALVRSLRVLLLLGLAALVAGIAFSLSANTRFASSAEGREQAAAADTGKRAEQSSMNVDVVRTRRGAPTLRLRARESRTYPGGELDLTQVTFRLFGPSGQETMVQAPSAVSTLQAATDPHRSSAQEGSGTTSRQSVGSWMLRGGVRVEAPGGLVLSTPSLSYSERDGQARTDQPVSFMRGPAAGSASGMVYDVDAQVARLDRDVTASMAFGAMGDVTVKGLSAVCDLARKTVEIREYRAVTQRGEVLTGKRLVAAFREGGGVERLQGEEGFVLESPHAIAMNGDSSPLSRLLALEGRRTITGQRIAILFSSESTPVSIEVSGDASLTASAAGREGAGSSVAAQTLVFDLLEGNLTRARAAGDVNLTGAPSEGESSGFHLASKQLDAALDPNSGSLLGVEGLGEIRLSDKDMQSAGSRTFLDPNADLVTLTGEEGRPASASWLGRSIQADRIEADRRQKTLTARGTIRVSYQPPAVQPGEAASPGETLPFFRGGETIYAMAGSLVFADQGRTAQYRDRVRLWQGENRLEASEIDVNENAGTLEARGEVISTFRQPIPEGRRKAGSPGEEVVSVASASMRYERTAGRVIYTGRVLATQGTLRVTAEAMTVTLGPDGRAAERMESSGKVELSDRGRTGHGDRLVADLTADTLRLSGAGREAVVQDESSQQVVRGSSLTMDRSGDRILVESELGGRTWITLKPRQKGAPGVGSDPGN